MRLVRDLRAKMACKRSTKAMFRCAESPVQEVDRVRGIIVQAAAALLRLPAPGWLGSPQDHWSVGFSKGMADLAKRSAGDQPRGFSKGSYIAIVITNLRDESFLGR